MAQADQEQIVFGPGGQISNVEQNKNLLDQLQETPALLPDELLKLAEFFKAYPTGVPHGNHLALLALATREGELVSQKVFTEYSDSADFNEDYREGEQESREPRVEDETVRLSVRRVLVSGIGLLIETLDFKTDPGAKSFHFVIGVSPAPDSLPESKP